MIKEKLGKNEIQTPELSVTGNIMSWKNTVIQLSNISSISTVPIEPVAFPKGIFIVCLVGFVFFCMSVNILLALILLALACAIVYLWYKQNEQLKNKKNLQIMLNSGKMFIIDFSDEIFLGKVYGVLCSIIADGNTRSEHIKINIENSSISGDAHVLNDLIL